MSPLVSFIPTMLETSWARRSTRLADRVYPTRPGLLYKSTGSSSTASAIALKWVNSSVSVGFKNMGCSTEIPAAPPAAAILARRIHFLVLMAPIPKYTGTRPAT